MLSFVEVTVFLFVNNLKLFFGRLVKIKVDFEHFSKCFLYVLITLLCQPKIIIWFEFCQDKVSSGLDAI